MTESITVHHGDSRDVLKTLADASIDSVVCDPPYALVSIGKRFGADDAAAVKPGKTGAYARASAGFMGKKWDTGETAFDPDFWAEVLRVLKPGGHLIAFSGTRTYHRLACAVEDAGFEIRDMIQWLYGSGFPKSHNVGKKTGRAEEDGLGTALKPACEPIVLARKPLTGTVAANVLAHGTGALNIGGCRIGSDGGTVTIKGASSTKTVHAYGDGLGAQGGSIERVEGMGRWPANVIHDGSEEVVEAFPEGSARFFYSAKADSADRLGSKHPTVKPVDLMAYLCRLVTPPGGIVLDPFAGSGSTGMACLREGFRSILIEREAEYVEDIRRRLKHVKGEDTPLFG